MLDSKLIRNIPLQLQIQSNIKMYSDLQRNQYSIFLSSAFSSIISTLITNPIEVAKTNIQYYPLSCRFYPHSNFKQLISCGCSSFSLQGSIKSLKVVVPQVTLSNVFYMQLYENRVQFFKDKMHYGVMTSTFLSVMIARTIVSTFMLPLQVLRVRLSNDIKSEGPLFKFSGFKVTLVRDLSYSMLFWLTLQNIRNYWIGANYRDKFKNSQHTSRQILQLNLLPALVSGSMISAITTPVDTIKTRLQSSAETNPSIIKELKNIYQKQGMMGLFSGVHFRVLKNSIHSSLYIGLFQFSMNKITKKPKE